MLVHAMLVPLSINLVCAILKLVLVPTSWTDFLTLSQWPQELLHFVPSAPLLSERDDARVPDSLP